MIRILSAIDTSEHASTVIDYSCFVAGVLQADIVGLCVVETKKIEGPLLRDYLSTVGLDAGLDYKGAVRTFLESKSAELLDGFEKECTLRGISFRGVVEHGNVSQHVTACAEDVDLVILGRKGEHAEWHANPLGGSVESVLRRTPKPVLVTPRKFVEINRALIAYDGSRYSRDALDLASRIHKATKLEGIVLNVQPEKDESASARVKAEVDAFLAERDCAFRFEVAEGDPGTWIPTMAQRFECELVVMGAYGHSKIREMILGSATQQVLMNTPKLPLLMCR